MTKKSISASQEISLLNKVDQLKQVMTSVGLAPPKRVLTYNCVDNLIPTGMAILGYEVHAVNSDSTNIQQMMRRASKRAKAITCASYPIFEMSEHETQPFDIVIIDGLAVAELRTDVQLQKVCHHIAKTTKPDGLLAITMTNFDETLQTRDRMARPYITEDATGRYIQVIVRDWHGNGYEYTESHYSIRHSHATPSVVCQQYQRRAWQNAEISLAVIQAGFQEIRWHSETQNMHLLTAKNTGQVLN